MGRAAPIVAVAALVSWLGACSPLKTLNAFIPTDGFEVNKGIAYGPDDRQALDVYTPRDIRGPAPVVVFYYGGSWKYGQRQNYRFVAEALTSRGFVAVLPDYRVYPEVTFPAFVEDGAAALRWVHDNIGDYQGDPRRIYVMGHSAGAYIAAHLSLDPRYLDGEDLSRDIISGMVGISGPYAFDPLEYRSVRDIFAGHPDPNDLRPINFADGSAPPMLLLHGGDDNTVYPTNSRLLAEKINAAGGEARYVEIDDTGHIAIVLALAKPFRRDGGVLDTTMEFIGDREVQSLAGRSATPASQKTFRR